VRFAGDPDGRSLRVSRRRFGCLVRDHRGRSQTPRSSRSPSRKRSRGRSLTAGFLGRSAGCCLGSFLICPTSGPVRKFVELCRGGWRAAVNGRSWPGPAATGSSLARRTVVSLRGVLGRRRSPIAMSSARLISYAADGMADKDIAIRCDCHPEVVSKWRRRFCEQGIEELTDKPRAGRPRRFPPAAGRRGRRGGVRAADQARPAAGALLAH
jgi:hypothetical protein